MHITDNTQQEVIRIERPFMCCAAGGCCGCCDGCNPEIRIEAPVGTPIGSVKSQWYCCEPRMAVFDNDHNQIFNIQGPCIACVCCSDADFNVIDANTDQVVGNIQKQWSGCCTEYLTDADNFSITCKGSHNFKSGDIFSLLVSVPLEMDVRKKAILVGALFLIVSCHSLLSTSLFTLFLVFFVNLGLYVFRETRQEQQ